MTSIWAEWFKQNGMTHAEERERDMDDAIYLQPRSVYNPPSIDLMDGMLKQQADEIKRLKGERAEILSLIQDIKHDAILGAASETWVEADKRFGLISLKCDEALKDA